MKKYLFFLSAIISLLTMSSCSKEEVAPEITFPEGATNIFKSSIDFDCNAGESIITFNSNKPWTATLADTRDGSSWCSISPQRGEAGSGKLIVRVTENTNYDDRNAVIRFVYGDSIKNIIVNQKQKDALTLTTDKYEIPVEGGDVEINIKANVNYIYKIAEDCQNWIHSTNASGATRAMVSSKLVFKIDASQDYEKREGTIYVISGDKQEIVKIYQAGAAMLTLTQNDFNLSSAEQNITIEINSNFSYAVDMPNVDWIKEDITTTRAMSTHTLNLHVAANNTYDNRVATIRIYDKKSSLSETITINQSQLNAILLEKKDYVFDENGGEFSVNLKSNVNYKVHIADSWITENTIASSSTRALASHGHTFTVAKMEYGKERSTKITFTDKNTGTAEEITITQKSPLYFNNSALSIFTGNTKRLNLVNETGQNVTWSSSEPQIVSVDNQGNIKALKKGSATITVYTADKTHSSNCKVAVKDISDYVSAIFSGGSIMSINGLIKYGSKLYWTFNNNSSESLKLVSMQLVDGVTLSKGSEMSVNTTVNANSSKSYSTSIGLFGIHAPVTCIFKYEYNGSIYTTKAIYEDNL